MKRYRFQVQGIVQGVGFRPTIYRIAKDLGLTGFVFNSSQGATIEVEGIPSSIEQFIHTLTKTLPHPGRIDQINKQEIPLQSSSSFEIVLSQQNGDTITTIPPEVATCKECIKELMDPDDPRYLYPFITCTLCGPRYTVVKNVPYDRDRTTMDVFAMCPNCRLEYQTPSDRRFHSQTNSCPECGPKISLAANHGQIIEYDNNAILQAIDWILQGKILAIKGMGGFHLCVDALNLLSVQELRKRKKRPFKPFALMADSIETIKQFANITSNEQSLLQSPVAPIVLLEKNVNSDRELPEIADNNTTLGFMLPYTPLHYLIFNHPEKKIRPRVLVMTSANITDEPIVIDNDDARSRLANLVDGFLFHDRDIVIRADDSIVKTYDYPVVLRRSRGYVPEPIVLKGSLSKGKPVLAVGPELKNTICFIKEDRIYLSQHIGDLSTPLATEYFEDTIDKLSHFYHIKPVICARDLHSDYYSSQWAVKNQNQFEHLFAIQHHHAHIASVMAEKNIEERVIGVAMDGTGLGTDGTIWGGEFLIVDYTQFQRFAHLDTIPLPGGDAATKNPLRIALSYYIKYGLLDRFINHPSNRLNKQQITLIHRMLEKKINSPITSSAGRLFDAVSAVLGFCDTVYYEGQAAIALETAASKAENRDQFEYIIKEGEGGEQVIDFSPVFAALINNSTDESQDRIRLARMFHNTISNSILDMCIKIREQTQLNKVVLTGGVFQNKLLLTYTKELLCKQGFEVFNHNIVPPNDGGIALGQAIIAREMEKCV